VLDVRDEGENFGEAHLVIIRSVSIVIASRMKIPSGIAW
jgi:ethanolamine utilization protein EutQ (cupin superfamily)